MNKDGREGMSDKQVLEYYKLYGRDRDIKQYLALPLTVDLDSTAEHIDSKQDELSNSNPSGVKDAVASTSQSTHEPEDRPEETESKTRSGTNIPENQEDHIKSSSEHVKVIKIRHDQEGDQQGFSFNVESEIEINYQIDLPQSDNDDIVQGIPDKNSCKPKGILKVDDGVKQKFPKHIELPADNETIMHLISPTSSIASNRRQTLSPTSSIASNRRLEWDSLADVGYNMTENILPKEPISTLERVALEERRKEQYKAVQDVFKIPSPTDNNKNIEQKSLSAIAQSPKFNKNIGKPTAESTPIAPKVDLSEVHDSDLIKINKNEQKINTRTDKPHLKHCKSLNDIDLKLLSSNQVNKYIQTTLPHDSVLKDTPHLDQESCEGGSHKKTVLGKENITKSPARNKYRSKMLRRQRILRRKLATSTPFQADGCEEHLPGISSSGVNALEVLKGDNRFNISQSTVGTNTIGPESENHGMRAESFEYMPGDAYNKRPNNETDPNLKSSDVKSSLKRSKKLENMSNITSSKSNSSISSKNDKQSYTSPNNESSTNSEMLFDEAKYSTLNRDIKTSVRLLNSLISSNKGNMELKKRMVRRVMKRLLEANYVDTSTAESSLISKSKDSQSSNIMHSTLNSASKSISTSASPDPSYSLPEHLIANVPWKPYKFSQGIDYIRVPKAQQENIEKAKLKNRDDTSNSTESFIDLGKKSVKSPENMHLIKQQKLLQQNLVMKQMGFDKKQILDTSGILSYVKKEKANQLAWINSEIQHLNYLKMLLESQSEKDKTDSSKTSHASSKPGQMNEIPNHDVVHPLMSNKEEKELKTHEIYITSKSTSAEEIEKDQRVRKEHFKSSPRKSRVTPNVSETNTSSSSHKSSIREQIRELTRNIELLKQSTQFAKNTSSAHSSHISYTEWDSHVNTSRAYSEVRYIQDSKNSSRDKRPIIKSADNTSEKSKSSNTEKAAKVLASAKVMIDNKDKSDKIDSSKFKTTESHSSDTHTSLKSATISMGGQNVSSKSTEKSRTSFSADPGWEMSLEKKIEQKPEMQTISTQTIDHVLKKDKTVTAKLKKCSHCKHSSCKCKRQYSQSSEKKSKDVPKAVAYVLTFENASASSNSSKPSRKPSLDEVKIKLPYKNESRVKSNKHRTTRKDINDNKKGKKSDSKKTRSKSILEEIELRESKTIGADILESNNKRPDESNNTSDVTIVNSSSINATSKCGDNSDSSTITNSKSTHTISESTLLSTSTDSFIMEGRQKTNNEKSHNPTVQECLMIYKSDFVRRAEKRRQIIQKISELRSERNEQRKRLLQLINDNPDIQHDIMNMKEILPKSTKPQRVFTSKEIRDMTRKKYKNLPEVKQKKRDVLRNNLYRNNRFIAGIFNKRLQKNVLQGKLTLSQSMTIVNGCD